MLISIQSAFAQNINGKEIALSTVYEVRLTFHSKIENYNFTESGADTLFDKPNVKQNKSNSSFTIMAKVEGFPSTTLTIVEGKNKHRFVLVYKKELNADSLLFYDFSDSKVLAKVAKEQDEKNKQLAQLRNAAPVTSNTTQSNNASNNTTTTPSQNNPVTVSVQANNAGKTTPAPADKTTEFTALVLAGQRAFISGNYDEAEVNFKKAADIDPKEEYVQKKLADIKVKRAEKENQDKKAIADKYQELLKNAVTAYNAGNYDEAEKLYQQALAANPADPWPQQQLRRIEGKRAEAKLTEENKRQEELYRGYLAAGAKALAAKSYDEARSDYQQALNIKPKDAIAQSKLKEIDKKLADQQLEEDNKKKDTYFSNFITLGNEALSKGSYDEAENAYNEALKIKPGNAEVLKLLDNIKNKRAQIAEKENQEKLAKERDEKYTQLIALGDKALLTELYETAKEYYTKANQLKPGEPYPSQKIAEIDKQLSSQAAEKDKHAKDSLLTVQYNMAVDKGEKALTAADFKNAKIAFQLAAGLKPDEQYPKNKLQEIDIRQQELTTQKKAEADSLQKVAQADKQYKMIMSQANAAFAKKDYEIAKKGYTEASNIKPNEDGAKEKLAIVTGKLDSIQLLKENDEKYETSIVSADSLAFVTKDFVEALKYYRQAAELKPSESYAQKQITYLQSELNRKAKEETDAKEEEERKAKFTKGMVSYDSAIAATRTLRFEEARNFYRDFLTYVDSSELNKYQYGYQALIKSAVDKIKDIDEYLARTKPKQVTQVSEPVPAKVDDGTKKKKKKA
ncbi:tetratricopeptide repeat protein [Chitinophagaceae bacterium DXS]|nr:tetratricopeptide repeat protein [Chitinophagaceae bacterium DXS]